MDFGKIETYGATLVQPKSSGPNGLMKAMARVRKQDPKIMRSPKGYDNVEAILPAVEEKTAKVVKIDTDKVIFRSARTR